MRIYSYGNEYDVEMIKTKYMDGNLCILLVCNDGVPFGKLTANLEEKLPQNIAYVDVNNIPDAERFIIDNKLGERTGKVKPSGFCVYPQYRFFRSKYGKSN